MEELRFAARPECRSSARGTPLCPAGHLPRKGGDWQLRWRFHAYGAGDWRKPERHLISPFAGEMAGRPEGGWRELDAAKRAFRKLPLPAGRRD
ncbi:MAG: hypothetical protein EOS38_17325 [Mesorhizobium sp.]|nr:hypothetical protein EOA38_04195 [Mesorhizobium sp. M1E.F.Ca.ET.041.01.1.1]RWD87540.1 MAG: hypothetical protein EOS38_17325 [Mesorhizobium sp.]TIV54480.1 MAG: hypothetical protein E5V88_05145 [Mesorhizobium sp.]